MEAGEPVPEVPVGPPDPFAHLIGHDGPIREKDAFEELLDAVAAEAPTDMPEAEPQYEKHDWKTIKDAIYEDDLYTWRCRRCFREIRAARNETVEQACQRVNLNPDCGLQTAAEVMDS